MATYTDTKIVDEIVNYIKNSCNAVYYSDFYVGIAEDPRNRLFNQHNVNEDRGCWIMREGININHSRSAEKILINRGMKGGDGGGSDKSVWVYCYKITNSTIE